MPHDLALLRADRALGDPCARHHKLDLMRQQFAPQLACVDMLRLALGGYALTAA